MRTVHRNQKQTAHAKTLKLILSVLIVAGVLTGLAPKAIRVSTNEANSSFARAGPQTIGQLLDLPAQEFQRCDIAVMNLLCAKGLRGAENLDIAACLSTLDQWAQRVRFETERHLYRFQRNPHEYENSLAYYKMIMLVTVIQQDFGIHYSPDRARDPDFSDSRDLLIHGLLGANRTGTCASMPVLDIAIGRRLGYPLHLVQAKSHLFVRWEDKSERLNIEATSRGILCRDDAYYAKWPEPLTDQDIASGAFLRNLTRSEELAVFLNARGNCLEDNSRFPEAHVAYATAYSLAPQLRDSIVSLALSVHRERPALVRAIAGTAPSPPNSSSFPNEMVNAMNEHNQRMLQQGHALSTVPTATQPPGSYGPLPNHP